MNMSSGDLDVIVEPFDGRTADYCKHFVVELAFDGVNKSNRHNLFD